MCFHAYQTQSNNWSTQKVDTSFQSKHIFKRESRTIWHLLSPYLHRPPTPLVIVYPFSLKPLSYMLYLNKLCNALKSLQMCTMWCWTEQFAYSWGWVLAPPVVCQLTVLTLCAKFQTTLFVCFSFSNKQSLEKKFICKLKDWLSNSIGPDEMAHYEPSHLDLCCLQNLNNRLWQWKS